VGLATSLYNSPAATITSGLEKAGEFASNVSEAAVNKASDVADAAMAMHEESKMRDAGQTISPEQAKKFAEREAPITGAEQWISDKFGSVPKAEQTALDAYGNLKSEIANRPLPTLTNIALASTGVGGALRGAAGLAGEGIAGTALGAGATAAETLGKAVDPFYYVGKVASPITTPIANAGANIARGMGIGAQSAADARLAAMSSDPQAALAALRAQREARASGNLGIPATTATLAGDPGLAKAEQAADVSSEAFRTSLQNIAGQQNEARASAIEGMAPASADPMEITKRLQDTLSKADREHAANVANLVNDFEAKNATIPGIADPETLGATLRSQLEAAKGEKNAKASALFDPIDPNGELNIVAHPIASAANDITGSISKLATPPSKVESELLGKAATLPPVEKYNDIRALDSSISDAMSAELRSAGETQTYRRLVQLKSSVRNALDNAMDNQAEFMAGDPKSAWRRHNNYLLTNGKDDLIQDPILPNMSENIASQLNAAKAAWADYKRTFLHGPVGESLRTTGFAGDYRKFSSDIPDSAFKSGNTGYEATKSFLGATKKSTEAVGALQDMATNALRKEMGANGELTPAILARWKNKYQHSLRAIDEVSPKFSSKFDHIADAKKAVEDYQTQSTPNRIRAAMEQSPAKNFLGLQDTDGVRKQVASLLSSRRGANDIKTLIAAAGHDPDIIAGLQSAGVDHMIKSFSNAGVLGDRAVVSGAKFRKFLDENGESVRALYGDRGYNNMKSLARDFEQEEKKRQYQKATIGSNTAQNIIRFQKEQEATKHLGSGTLHGIATYEAMSKLMSGNMLGAAKAFFLPKALDWINALRDKGIYHVNDLVRQGLLDPEIGESMLTRALSKNRTLNTANIAKMVAKLDAAHVVNEQENARRPQRASGGPVSKRTHEQLVSRLMDLAEKAKKDVKKDTKPLLNAPDEAVVKALAVAQRAI
jgi:hypothetical protein